ncbi:MAG: hypothetical protein M3Q93_02360 [Gemmatimonadota bacterium]|nr:hypothetical protein [Gemmatimonadota bacterium]
MREFPAWPVLALLISVAPAEAQTLRSFEFRADTAVVRTVIDSSAPQLTTRKDIAVLAGRYEVYADGNLKDVVGSTDGTTSASGSLGVSYATEAFSVNLLVNAVGNATPLRDNFGTALLAPAAGSSLNAGVVDVRWNAAQEPKKGLCGTFGLRGYGSISSARWQTDTSGTTAGVVTPGAGLGGFCQLLSVHPSAPAETEARSLSAVLDIGLAVRGIGGDIAQTANDTIRMRLIGSDTRTKVGLEIGLALQVNGIKAGLTYYSFPGETPGLSDGQVIAGFSVQSAFLHGNVARAPTPEERREYGVSGN